MGPSVVPDVHGHVRNARVLHNVTPVNRDTGEMNVSTTAPDARMYVIKTTDAMLVVRQVSFKKL